MSRRGGGGGFPAWLLAVLIGGVLAFALVERDMVKAVWRSFGVVVGSTEGAGGRALNVPDALPDWPLFGLADDARPALSGVHAAPASPAALATIVALDGGGPGRWGPRW